MATNISTNMNLPVPQVGVEAGPQYATDINNCLTLVDQHNHSPGYGVAINPTGININSDLTFSNNNLTAARSIRFQSQTTTLVGVADLGCLYESGVDLYYNDGSGNVIRITQAGGVSGAAGNISGLVSPASATYSAGTQTFIWQSAANTPANTDIASLVLRNLSAGSNGLTLSPPAAMGSNYTLTLPSLPGATNIMTLDTSGNMAATLNVDNSTLQISGSTLQVKASGIGTAQIANGAVTPAKQSTKNIVFGSDVTVPVSGGPTTITSISITTSGRPVFVGIQDGGTPFAGTSFISTGSGTATIYLYNNATLLSQSTLVTTSGNLEVPPGCVWVIDAPSAGTQTYILQGQSNSTVTFSNIRLVAYEL